MALERGTDSARLAMRTLVFSRQQLAAAEPGCR